MVALNADPQDRILVLITHQSHGSKDACACAEWRGNDAWHSLVSQQLRLPPEADDRNEKPVGKRA